MSTNEAIIVSMTLENHNNNSVMCWRSIYVINGIHRELVGDKKAVHIQALDSMGLYASMFSLAVWEIKPEKEE